MAEKQANFQFTIVKIFSLLLYFKNIFYVEGSWGINKYICFSHIHVNAFFLIFRDIDEYINLSLKYSL